VSRRTLLLGLGNDILSDDGVGLRVAAAIEKRLTDRTNVTVVSTTEMGLSLLDQIVGFDDLVIVDAVQTPQGSPGSVHEIDGNALASLPAVSPHFLGLGEVLALGRKLGLAVPDRVRIFAIEVQDPFTVSTDLTPSLESALPSIVDRVIRTL